eukprot:scaffold3953_cov169-Amphora_coffeaeformis.AAC.26
MTSLPRNAADQKINPPGWCHLLLPLRQLIRTIIITKRREEVGLFKMPLLLPCRIETASEQNILTTEESSCRDREARNLMRRRGPLKTGVRFAIDDDPLSRKGVHWETAKRLGVCANAVSCVTSSFRNLNGPLCGIVDG